MQIRNEFRCRRCSKLFFHGEHYDVNVLESVWATIEDDAEPPVAHECDAGGVGVGDWIGASEVKAIA